MKKILFVCLGNICRSPAAHGVMENEVKRLGKQDEFFIDSAGTSGQHSGDLPDARMRQSATSRGYTLDSLSRKFTVDDFEEFDLILAMDKSNLSNILKLDSNEKYRGKVRLFCEFCTRTSLEEVPDPYWSGRDGFEQVLDIVEDGVQGILKCYESEKK
ncbi:low molecular weight protein-tyrosine-phosphatase [Bacteriovorax sp. Seq25_V]|uniref:low molecular weight protein-tyrosine-phosphatase n=1 Tax=Bacteriovorax sp. Seq25_V TaxID=1201288 RepID=UPI00038A3D0C|nr:low molecular weight protein-tyrosine-phosphatase [Bacteriovorax sp. Seq25_V]EQC45649.1 low molecular weight phosphotyrosine protein phosphatase [Bacteriovorax sp. Seq25_V]